MCAREAPLLLLLVLPAAGQETAPPAHTSPDSKETGTDLLVSVRGPSGAPLDAQASVQLKARPGGKTITAVTGEGAVAAFQDLSVGEYEVEVHSAGYQSARQQDSITVPGGPRTLYFFLEPVSASPTGNRAPGEDLLSPGLRRVMRQGLNALAAGYFPRALQSLRKVERGVPGNLDVQYFLGVIEYRSGEPDAARSRFENILARDAYDDRALTALGELQISKEQDQEAVLGLERALENSSLNWRAHALLALASARLRNSEKAFSQLAILATVDRFRAPLAGMIKDRVPLLAGKTEASARAFENIWKSYLKDASAQDSLDALNARNDGGEAHSPGGRGTPLLGNSKTSPGRYSWAPPDIDSLVPAVVPGVTCSGTEVSARTLARMLRLMGNFERFSATEHVVHQEVGPSGIAGPAKARDFSYLVFVEQPKKNEYYLNEKRNLSDTGNDFPTQLVTQGLVGLGMYVFHPVFSSDFQYTCEGLGQWRGQAVWHVRFEQRLGVPSRVRIWRIGSHFYPIPLKGRALVAANTFDVLHLETDLREPVPLIQLNREHLIVDYGPVNFEKTQAQLWLPWHAEMFLELRGGRYRHRHTLTNYKLFSIDTNETIAAPKQN